MIEIDDFCLSLFSHFFIILIYIWTYLIIAGNVPWDSTTSLNIFVRISSGMLFAHELCGPLSLLLDPLILVLSVFSVLPNK